MQNFLSNSLRVRDPKLASQAWDAVSSEVWHVMLLSTDEWNGILDNILTIVVQGAKIAPAPGYQQ